MNKLTIPAVLLWACLLLLFSCSPENKQETEQAGSAQYTPAVEIGRCTLRDYAESYETFGTISYVTKADVFPMSNEVIRKMYFEEGDSVRKGDILARLNPQKLEIQIREAAAGVRIRETGLNLARQQLEEGRRNMEAQFLTIENARLELQKKEADLERLGSVYENKKQLFEINGISREEMASLELDFFEKELEVRQSRSNLAVKMIGYRDEDLLEAGYILPDTEAEKIELFLDCNTRMLQAEVEVAEAELEAARSQQETLELYLSETAVRAPISGLIGQKYMEEGEKVSTEKPLYMIYPDREVYALAEVGENDLLRLEKGQQAQILTDTSNQVKTGTIEKISPWVKQENRCGTVKIHLENGDAFFRVGQFIRIAIYLSEEKQTLMIPEEAVLFDGETPYAYSLRGNRIFRRDLECGKKLESERPVWSGLDRDDRIVLNPRESFRDGMEVVIQ